jgi:hypothetical protein
MPLLARVAADNAEYLGLTTRARCGGHEWRVAELDEVGTRFVSPRVLLALEKAALVKAMNEMLAVSTPIPHIAASLDQPETGA